MTESDWRRLHTRVIPNPVPLDEFKNVVLTGKLQDRYLAKDLHKMMQELRDLLREHGELREAAIFPLSGKKQELSAAAAAAVRVIDAHRERVPVLRRSPSTSAAPPDAAESRDGSNSPTLDSASDQQRLSTSGVGGAEQTSELPLPSSLTPSNSPRRSSRPLPLVDHIAAEEQPLISSTMASSAAQTPGCTPIATSASPSPSTTRLREPAVARNDSANGCAGQAERSHREPTAASVRLATSWTSNERLSSTIAQHAATTTRPHVHTAASATAPAPSGALPSSSTSLPPPPPPTAVGSSATLSNGAANELAQLNEAAPPFFRILGVVRRFQLRFGSSPLKFEIPVQYTEAVHNRRLRVYLIPLRHPNIPARWPTAKEIVVYVNEQCVMTPWKRSWPDRKQEVAKTFLPLDITYLLSRNMPSQRMQVDIFNKEYLSPAIVAVVQPQSLEEVTESMLLSRLGCRSVTQALSTFDLAGRGEGAQEDEEENLESSSSSPFTDQLLSNDTRVRNTYAAILDEDEEDDGLEADDPVITTKCPISQLPLAVPVRGSRCTHLQCVDLDAFLVSSNKGAYWNCALCDAEMRPRDVQIDTVLWRYLRAFGSPEAYPSYLRLSARPPGSVGQSKFYWHPSTRTGENADVISDDDDSEKGEIDDERRREHEKDLLRPPALSTPENVWNTAEATTMVRTPTSSNASGEGERAPQIESDRKRSREEEADAGEPQGTADDPIEL